MLPVSRETIAMAGTTAIRQIPCVKYSPYAPRKMPPVSAIPISPRGQTYIMIVISIILRAVTVVPARGRGSIVTVLAHARLL